MTGSVVLGWTGAVAVLTLHAAERKNALSRQMLTDLAAALASVDDADGVVLTGGDECFSAGADLREITGTVADLAYDDAVADVAQAIDGCAVPVIAALEGPCLGAAAHLALLCDVRIAGADAFVQIPAVRLGLLYSPDAVEWLARTYRRDTVRRLLLCAERFDAEAAVAAGLVSTIVLAGAATRVAVESLGGLSPRSRQAVAATRTFLRHAEAGTVVDDHWQERRRELLASPDRAAAVAAAHRRHGGIDAQNTE
ncbi:enoyl-CoA hydratase/isomerase family protein [Gordonia sp. HY002]|uniref:enoyl-CoA hydratase/isomerase family protein n=1 Tax=Gordonia zhenghanii TaxID=2911516 RepID=UPI001EEFB2AE|nr:enoyl-CoA hydratase/isomerase family protein [Gordonia zhenghanii]MCF8570389.1 enoyl-CoA hydratase/isomerase family protein [Gordonia zhenghanii]MCF8604619.1 enoyl-CoA hydratase/isomerase family protein [Gordonia zhenghanii]